MNPPCRSEDPELFYPPPGAGNRPTVEAAKAICARCPVTTECLQVAMEAETTELRYGIWGGLTAKERHALAKGDA